MFINGVYQVPGTYAAQGPTQPNLQGTSPSLQGDSTVLQGTSPNLQGGQTGSQLGVDAAQIQATNNTINNAYAPAQANWAALYGNLDRQTAFNNAQVENQWNSQNQGLNANLATGQGNLDRSQAGVDYTRSSGLRQLSRNIEGNLNSRMSQLGTAGAGSSSAGYGLSMALHGVEQQNRGDIVDQAGLQYGDIALQRTNMKKQYDGAVQQLSDWKTGEIAKIANDYLNQRSSIEQSQAGGDAGQQAAIAQQSVQLAQQAAASLARIQATHAAAINSLQAGTTSVGDNNANLANFDHKVTALNGTNPSIQYQGGTNPVSSAYNPLVYKRPDQSY